MAVSQEWARESPGLWEPQGRGGSLPGALQGRRGGPGSGTGWEWGVTRIVQFSEGLQLCPKKDGSHGRREQRREVIVPTFFKIN